MSPSEFEAITGLSGYEAAILLRVSKSKWYEWASGGRDLPPYIEASMEAHAALAKVGALAPLVERRKLARKLRPTR